MIDTYDIHHWRILWSSYRNFGLRGIWTHDHWIPFRRSNRLSHQATSSNRTQSQLCTAAPISSIVQCQVFLFWLLPLSVATFILIVWKFPWGNHVSVADIIYIYIYIYIIYYIIHILYTSLQTMEYQQFLLSLGVYFNFFERVTPNTYNVCI